MSDNDATVRRLTPAETEELNRLYAELPAISAVTAEALGEGDPAGITRISAILERIDELGG
jgi:hypothetical protein